MAALSSKAVWVTTNNALELRQCAVAFAERADPKSNTQELYPWYHVALGWRASAPREPVGPVCSSALMRQPWDRLLTTTTTVTGTGGSP